MSDGLDNKQPCLFENTDLFLNDNDASGYAVMYCDGACSGNPGKSGAGVVITLTDKNYTPLNEEQKYTISEYIGVATNNIAEYSALIKGLEKARTLSIENIKIFLDSELIVRQVNGVYKVKNRNLLPLFQKVKDLLKNFEAFTLTHVRREFNKDADALARLGVEKSNINCMGKVRLKSR